MAKVSRSPKSCANFEMRLPNSSNISDPIICKSKDSQRVYKSRKTCIPERLRVSNVAKRRNLSSQKLHNSRFLQQIILSSETRQKMAPSHRSQCPEQTSVSSNIQNGNSRNHSKFGYKRLMASLNRPHRRLLSCSDSQKLSTSPAVSFRRSKLPV